MVSKTARYNKYWGKETIEFNHNYIGTDRTTSLRRNAAYKDIFEHFGWKRKTDDWHEERHAEICEITWLYNESKQTNNWKRL